MRRAVSVGGAIVAVALTLSACGGSGGSSDSQQNEAGLKNLGNTGNRQDAAAHGPVTIPGAQTGGTVTVLTNLGMQTTLDPSEIYYTDTTAIMSGLVTRSLTQNKYDPESKQMVLVPDLATDLGKHNDDFTKWTFTIRDGIKFEDGTPVTAKNIAWGIQRCMDAKTFPTGACQYYANGFFRGGQDYKGPYTDPQQKFTSVKVSGNTLTIYMDRPFPDMPYWGTFPAMGPMPLGKSASDPTTYKNHPLATGPYMFKSFTPNKELQLVKNPNWDPKTDPARTQYPDGYDFKTQVPSEKIDQVMLADSGSGQTTLTYDDLLAQDYQKMKTQSPDRLTTGGQPCTYYWAPDYRKVTDKAVREAMLWAYPYKGLLLAGGFVPGVNAIAATNLMAPGVPGRTAYNVTGHGDFQTDPAKARALLKKAGKLGYEIRFLFRTDDNISVQSKDVLVKALTEAGFKATPVPTTIAKYPVDRDNPDTDINVRSAGWCSDWPSGSTWIPTVYGSTHPDKTGSLGTNYAAFSNAGVDRQAAAVQRLPLDRQPAAWNDLDRSIMKKFLPLIPYYYGGVIQAHGSKVMGDNDDTTLGAPTYKDIWIQQ